MEFCLIKGSGNCYPEILHGLIQLFFAFALTLIHTVQCRESLFLTGKTPHGLTPRSI